MASIRVLCGDSFNSVATSAVAAAAAVAEPEDFAKALAERKSLTSLVQFC